MSRINTEKDLLIAIREIELRQKSEGEILRIQFRETYNSLKPINIIKNSIKDVFVSDEVKTDLLNTAIAFSAGIASKKLFEMVSSGPLTKLTGNSIMIVVSKAVAGNPEIVKSIGNTILGLFRKKEVTKNPAFQDEN